MNEVFSLPVKPVEDSDGLVFQIDDALGDLLVDGSETYQETCFSSIAHAINMHDELVGALELLTAMWCAVSDTSESKEFVRIEKLLAKARAI